MRGAGVSTGRHRRNVTRKQNEESRRRGAAPVRRDIGDDRYARFDNRLDNLTHRALESAGGVDRQKDGRSTDFVRVPDAAHNVIGADRLDNVGEGNFHDDGTVFRYGRRTFTRSEYL